MLQGPSGHCSNENQLEIALLQFLEIKFDISYNYEFLKIQIWTSTQWSIFQ